MRRSCGGSGVTEDFSLLMNQTTVCSPERSIRQVGHSATPTDAECPGSRPNVFRRMRIANKVASLNIPNVKQLDRRAIPLQR